MRGGVELLFSPEARDVLDKLENDESNGRLVDAIWDVLDLITEHPGSAQSRHRALRTAGGHSVWLVPGHGLYDGQGWVGLLEPPADDAPVAYIGPGDLPPGAR